MMRDVRLGLRRWRQRPVYALTVVLTLALGIGTATASFSVVDALLLRPLPWSDPERLVAIWAARPELRGNPAFAESWQRGAITWPDFLALKNERAFTQIGVWTVIEPVLSIDAAAAEVVTGINASSTLLPVLGVEAVIGRSFTPDEEAVASDSVIISHRVWQQKFGGDPAIAGRQVGVADLQRTIVGVLPPGFVLGNVVPDVVLPLGVGNPAARARTFPVFQAIARLAPGASEADARASTTAIMRPDASSGERVAFVEALDAPSRAAARTPTMALLMASGVLLLIACTNVAGLLLADAAGRRREAAVRAALGAAPVRLAREVLIESAVLAAGGGVGGFLIASAVMPAIVAFAPAEHLALRAVSVDLRALAFALTTGFATTFLFAAAPSLSAAMVSPIEVLKRASGRSVGGRRTQSAAVVAQVTLAFVLLMGAGLLVETVDRLAAQPPGFDSAGIGVVRLRVPRSVTAAGVRSYGAHTSGLIARLNAVPGVAGAAAGSATPFSSQPHTSLLTIEGHTDPVPVRRLVVTEGWFETLGVRRLKGATFTGTEPESARSTVVSAAMERTFFGGHAVGRRFTLGTDSFEIIGVVEDVKHVGLQEDGVQAFYGSNRQMSNYGVPEIVLRLQGDPSEVLRRVRDAIHEYDKRLVIVSSRTMDELRQATLADERYRALLAGLFALAALTLAGIGVYGALSRMVADSRRDLALRLSLGALPRRLALGIAGRGLGLVTGGVVAGGFVSLVLAGAIETYLFGVEVGEANGVVFAALVMATAASMAIIVPVIRAGRTSPASILRASD